MWATSKAIALLPLLLVTCAATHRKSLGFSPELNHRSFNTKPDALPRHLISQSPSAKDLGELYLEHQLKLRKGSYRLREDSYRDSTTGIWHLYYRQVVFDGALEISDGDINLNILNGQVLSYGDSVSVNYQSS
jgi:extracellular elastinolytic metalloproteinase